MPISPTRKVVEDVAQVAGSVVELARLQTRLVVMETKRARRRILLVALLGIGAAVLALAGIPIGLAGGALLAAPLMGISPAASLTIAGVVAVALAVGLGVWCWRAAVQRAWFPISLAELRRTSELLSR